MEKTEIVESVGATTFGTAMRLGGKTAVIGIAATCGGAVALGGIGYSLYKLFS